jgi:hypothetical protein
LLVVKASFQMIQGANEPSVILSAETWAEDLLQDLNQLTVSAVWKSGIHNSIMGRNQLQN